MKLQIKNSLFILLTCLLTSSNLFGMKESGDTKIGNLVDLNFNDIPPTPQASSGIGTATNDDSNYIIGYQENIPVYDHNNSNKTKLRISDIAFEKDNNNNIVIIKDENKHYYYYYAKATHHGKSYLFPIDKSLDGISYQYLDKNGQPTKFVFPVTATIINPINKKNIVKKTFDDLTEWFAGSHVNDHCGIANKIEKKHIIEAGLVMAIPITIVTSALTYIVYRAVKALRKKNNDTTKSEYIDYEDQFD